MELGMFEIYVGLCVAALLGALGIALVCDLLKGNNEQLRERNIELRVRQDEREKLGFYQPLTWLQGLAALARNPALVEGLAGGGGGQQPAAPAPAVSPAQTRAAAKPAAPLAESATERTAPKVEPKAEAVRPEARPEPVEVHPADAASGSPSAVRRRLYDEMKAQTSAASWASREELEMLAGRAARIRARHEGAPGKPEDEGPPHGEDAQLIQGPQPVQEAQPSQERIAAPGVAKPVPVESSLDVASALPGPPVVTQPGPKAAALAPSAVPPVPEDSAAREDEFWQSWDVQTPTVPEGIISFGGVEPPDPGAKPAEARTEPAPVAAQAEQEEHEYFRPSFLARTTTEPATPPPAEPPAPAAEKESEAPFPFADAPAKSWQESRPVQGKPESDSSWADQSVRWRLTPAESAPGEELVSGGAELAPAGSPRAAEQVRIKVLPIDVNSGERFEPREDLTLQEEINRVAYFGEPGAPDESPEPESRVEAPAPAPKQLDAVHEPEVPAAAQPPAFESALAGQPAIETPAPAISEGGLPETRALDKGAMDFADFLAAGAVEPEGFAPADREPDSEARATSDLAPLLARLDAGVPPATDVRFQMERPVEREPFEFSDRLGDELAAASLSSSQQGLAPAPESPALPMPMLPVEEEKHLEIPAGLQEAEVMSKLLESSEPFSGVVVAIGINDYQSLREKLQGAHETDSLLALNKMIQSMLRPQDFATRFVEDEFILLYPGESGASAQRRLFQVSEKLWDFQLRSLGHLSVMFSWGGLEVSNETLAEAVASARERMYQTKRNRKAAPDIGISRRRVVNG